MNIRFNDVEIESIRQRIAAGETSDAIGETYGCDRRVILRLARKHSLGPWANRTNILCQQKRPIPADFAEKNAVMSDNAMAQYYKCGGSLPARWRKELGIPPKHTRLGGSNKFPTPADFKEYAPGKTLQQLCDHYNLGFDTIRRMRKEEGIAAQPAGWSGRKLNPAKPAHLVRNAYLTMPVDRTTRDASRAGMAAEFLRRDAPVYRCRPLGAADAQGTHWRYGRVVLTDDEVIERAERKGWAPSAWMKVQAA